MRGTLIFAGKIVISALLLYFTLRAVDFSSVDERLRRVDASWMAPAMLLLFAQIFLLAIRWREIASRCGGTLTVGAAFRYTFIGAFFNQTLPSAIGGDAVRLWLIRRAGVGWRGAAFSVLIDRAIGLIAVALMVMVSLPWSYQLIADDKGRLGLLLVDVLAIGGGAAFLLLGRLSWSWLKTWLLTRDMHACSGIANKILFGAKSGAIVVSLSIVLNILTVATVWCIARSIGSQAQFASLFLLVPPVLMLTLLPVSIAGWGLREAIMTVAFGYAGLPPADGLMVSLLYGVANFLVGAAGGLMWLFNRRANSADAGEASGDRSGSDEQRIAIQRDAATS